MSTVSVINSPPRTLVLCFDGTGNLYDATNTNVVKLFSLLRKDDRHEQLVYYQAGIGTYSAPGIMTSIGEWIATHLDEAFAWHLDAHVMGGYHFLMQNYLCDDRICLFGFSRGAYTARALAGMLHKVGLLPRDNKEQVGFAYDMYKSTGKNNRKLAYGFKQTFSRTVRIEFMGCWDTVSSVGIFWGRHLPFTSSNTIIKRFRHALALDERRAKFQPNTWHRDAPDASSARKDPESGSNVSKGNESNQDDGVLPDQPGDPTDVLEVWFAGSHSDVSGGETPSDEKYSLSNISLRWMIREIVQSQCGIRFDNDAIARAGIPLSILLPGPKRATDPSQRGASFTGYSCDFLTADTKLNGNFHEPAVKIPETLLPLADGGNSTSEDALDAVKRLNDELKTKPIWWLLEFVPSMVSWQDKTGKWNRTLRMNLGRARTICDASPNIHTSVHQRMATKSLAYVPNAKWDNKPDANWVT